MSKVSLKRLLRKRNSGYQLLIQIVSRLKIELSIWDSEGNLLIGDDHQNEISKSDVFLNQEKLGSFYCSAHTDLISDYLHYLVHQEKTKKEIGAEVLDLYREINAIYNYTENLSDTIETADISELALSEISHLINSDGGLVILENEENKKLEVLAAQGPDQTVKAFLDNSELITEIISTAQTTVIRADNTQLPATVQTAICAPLKVKQKALGIILLYHSQKIEFDAADLKLLTTIAIQTASAIESALLYEKRMEEAKEREAAVKKIHDAANRFVPFEFIKSLGRDEITEVKLGDLVSRNVTVLFTDIRNFTSFSESMSPEDNFLFVNALNKRMSPIVYTNHGFINQYIGDGIMAIFPNNPADAIDAAIEMQNTLAKYNQSRVSKGKATVVMGIGMHTGPLIMGITGDEQRMDASTISDTVNTASRLESLTKYYDARIIFSSETLQGVENGDEYSIRFVSKAMVKGKKTPVELYECFDGDRQAVITNKKKTLHLYSKGIKSYYLREFPEATMAFKEVLDEFPDDYLSKLYFTQSAKHTIDGVDEDWTGVDKILFK